MACALRAWQLHRHRARRLRGGSRHARLEAERRGWRFERTLADLRLVRRLLYGEWDADFQVLQPGQRLEMSFDDEVIRAAV